MSAKTVFYLVALSFQAAYVGSLDCYQCKNIQDPADCYEVAACPTDYLCAIESTTVGGQEMYNMSCKPKQECMTASTTVSPLSIIGRRRRASVNTKCSECCSRNACNKDLCPGSSQTGTCQDDATFDCAHISTLYPVCADVSHAKLVCRHYCNLCDLVDGSWADWSSWSTCDVTCGNGTIVRTRSCTNPVPAHGGSDCSGTNRQQSTCTLQACPVHGGWRVWSTWNNCSVSCGIGLQTRRRTCSNPFPDRFGDHCFGDSLENKACFLRACADGGWSGWSSWGVCSATCNGGIQNRTRRCDNPAPSAFGKACIGNDKDVQACHWEICPGGNVLQESDGGWSGWSSWGVCSATCNGGIQNRTRRCDNPAPSALGKTCPGNDKDFQACHGEACPVVAFKARNVVDTSPAYLSLIRYDTVVVNVGGGYSTSTGYFTAPYTGLYSFTVNICTYAGIQLWVQIVAAGNIIGTTSQHDPTHAGVCSSGDGVAELKAGDQVWIKCYAVSSGAVIYQSSAIWNSFSGTLIHRTV